MSADAARDLDEWMGRLISVWRHHRRAVALPRQRHGNRAKPSGRPELPPFDLTREELKEVADGVRTLSLGLTRNRELAGARYMDDPRLLGAYLLFYWPVSYSQARATLPEVPAPHSVLDLGCGPAPITFAAADAGARSLVAADRSRPALELARELAVEAGGSIATREWSVGKALPEGPFDLIVMGHLLNELMSESPSARAALVEQVAGSLTRGGTLLILEPALRETSRSLLEVRDRLVERGFAIRAPCLWRGPCPALHKQSDWCHAERAWNPPRLVASIARAAGLHKESLKMSYLALMPKGERWPELPEARLLRIVSEPLEGKGRQRYMACGPEGRLGLALQEKHASPANRAFFGLQRGDIITVTTSEIRGDGHSLTPDSEVRVAAKAGVPLRPPS